MEETGKVVAVVGELACVEIVRGSGCGSCKACSVSADGRTMTAMIRNDLHAKVGDRVLLTIPDRTITNLALLTYGLPTLCFLVGFFLFRWISPVVRLCGSADLASVLGAVFFTSAAFVAIRLVTVRQGSRGTPGRDSGTPIEFLQMAAILPAESDSQRFSR